MITKEEINTFPRFINHESARIWLKDRYGKFIVLSNVDYLNNMKIYYYHFVTDRERYIESKDREAMREEFDSSLYLNTFQVIEVKANGKIKPRF